jgi:hypothetical protein
VSCHYRRKALLSCHVFWDGADLPRSVIKPTMPACLPQRWALSTKSIKPRASAVGLQHARACYRHTILPCDDSRLTTHDLRLTR